MFLLGFMAVLLFLETATVDFMDLIYLCGYFKNVEKFLFLIQLNSSNDGSVVVVTFNYRLGIFGFFSTNDASAQGNWAMKDMIEALRWVRNNIHLFGGNPNQITVFGESAGSVAVRKHFFITSSS